MKTTTNSMSKAFHKARAAGDIRTAVQLARTATVDHVLSGAAELDDPGVVMEALTGTDGVPFGLTVPTEQRHTDVYAAFVAGIALGQLLHPDVFKTGGGR